MNIRKIHKINYTKENKKHKINVKRTKDTKGTFKRAQIYYYEAQIRKSVYITLQKYKIVL